MLSRRWEVATTTHRPVDAPPVLAIVTTGDLLRYNATFADSVCWVLWFFVEGGIYGAKLQNQAACESAWDTFFFLIGMYSDVLFGVSTTAGATY